MAAENHDRTAAFWEKQGDQERSALQREMAEFERHGAELECRWADIVDPKAGAGTTRSAEVVFGHTRQGARHLAVTLQRTARELERSARLAEEHASRREQAGRLEDAAAERRAAERAREAARRAGLQAEEWSKLVEERRQ